MLKRLIRQVHLLGVMAMLAPMTVDTDADTTSSSTRFTIAGGGGSYATVTRGCDNRIVASEHHSFEDIGGDIEHRTPGGRFGVRGGYLVDDRATFDPGAAGDPVGTYYVNPYVSTDDGPVGAGIGVVYATRGLYPGASPDPEYTLSGHLRLGPRKIHVIAAANESVPLYSGGGFATFGLGSQTPDMRMFVGLSAEGAYENVGALVRVELPVTNNWWIGTNLRFGNAGAVTEYGIGVNLTYAKFHD